MQIAYYTHTIGLTINIICFDDGDICSYIKLCVYQYINTGLYHKHLDKNISGRGLV